MDRDTVVTILLAVVYVLGFISGVEYRQRRILKAINNADTYPSGDIYATGEDHPRGVGGITGEATHVASRAPWLPHEVQRAEKGTGINS